MTPEDQKYFDSLIDMFAEKGWKYFVEDFQGARNQLDSIQGIDDAKTLHFKQGQLVMLDRILNFESTIRQSLQEIEDEEAA